MRLQAIGLALVCCSVGWGQTCIFAANDFGGTNGSYFLRHVQFTSDANNNVVDAKSVWGVITFDGKGKYTFSGTQVIGSNAPASYSSSGSYCPTYTSGAAYMTLTNPQDSSLGITTGLGRLLVGASQGTPPNTSDLMIAIPQYPNGMYVPYRGNLGSTVFSVTPGTPATVRSSGFVLPITSGNPAVQSPIASFQAQGRVSGVNNGNLLNQVYSSGTLTQTGTPGSTSGDGTGVIQLAAPTGDAANTPLLASSYNVGFALIDFDNTSNGGIVVLGGSATGHDILLGFDATTGKNNFGVPVPLLSVSDLSGDYVMAGIGYTPASGLSSYSGLGRVISPGEFLFSRRNYDAHSGAVESAATAPVEVNPDGSGTLGSQVFYMTNSRESWLDVPLDSADSNHFGLDIATALVPELPPGANPLPFTTFGVENGATLTPPNPAGPTVSPGEILIITGTGLAAQTLNASPPLPFTLGGVNLNIGFGPKQPGPLMPAPIYMVSPTLVMCVVPYGAQPAIGGVKMPIDFHSNGQQYSMSGVRLAATTPGVFTLNPAGMGNSVAQHADGAMVTAGQPASKGETLDVFVTGLGGVQGTAPPDDAGAPQAAPVVTTVGILVGGVAATVQSATVVAHQPGLYQVRFTVPPAGLLTSSGSLPLVITTPDATMQLAEIAVQ